MPRRVLCVLAELCRRGVRGACAAGGLVCATQYARLGRNGTRRLHGFPTCGAGGERLERTSRMWGTTLVCLCVGCAAVAGCGAGMCLASLRGGLANRSVLGGACAGARIRVPPCWGVCDNVFCVFLCVWRGWLVRIRGLCCCACCVCVRVCSAVRARCGAGVGAWPLWFQVLVLFGPPLFRDG